MGFGHYCAVFVLNICRDLYLDGNELQSQGVIDLVHMLVQQAVKDDEDRQEDSRIKTIEAIQAAALGLLLYLSIYFLPATFHVLVLHVHHVYCVVIVVCKTGSFE